jgi:hypothetical protein
LHDKLSKGKWQSCRFAQVRSDPVCLLIPGLKLKILNKAANTSANSSSTGTESRIYSSYIIAPGSVSECHRLDAKEPARGLGQFNMQSANASHLSLDCLQRSLFNV